MREKIVKLYKYAELSDKAKEKARDWHRRGVSEDFDAECTLDDAAIIAEFMGLDIRQRVIQQMNGKTRKGVSVYWQLHGQGSGASFDATWHAFKVQPGKVAEHAPQDAELARIAGEFERIAKAYPEARYSAKASGRYMSMDFDIDIEPPENHDDTERTSADWTVINHALMRAIVDVKEASRDFAHLVYKRIDAEYDYATSDAVLAEGIEANEYEFTEDGEIDS